MVAGKRWRSYMGEMNRRFEPRDLETLPTPSLLLDEAKLRQNIKRMKAKLASAPVILRPHLKTAKAVEVAHLAMESPSGPATVSTLGEVDYFFRNGVTDLLYAVGITAAKLPAVIAYRRAGCDLAVVLDSVGQARAVAEAGRAAGDPIPVLIEIDVDGHRGGVAPDSADLIAIAAALGPGAELRGIMAHAGESYSAHSVAELEGAANAERRLALLAAGRLREAGHELAVVSIGSTPTALCSGSLDGITEIRAGVYVFFDLVMAGLGVCSIEDIAISVLATVIGHYPDKGWLIVDAGWSALSSDRGTGRQQIDQGFGLVCDLSGRPFQDIIVIEANQEHGIIAVRPGSDATLPSLLAGTRVRILPNHACATAEQFDGYHVLDAAADRADRWWPRGSGWGRP